MRMGKVKWLSGGNTYEQNDCKGIHMNKAGMIIVMMMRMSCFLNV